MQLCNRMWIAATPLRFRHSGVANHNQANTGHKGLMPGVTNEPQLCADRCMMTSGRTRRSGAIGHLAVGHLAARAVAYHSQFRTGNSAGSADARGAATASV